MDRTYFTQQEAQQQVGQQVEALYDFPSVPKSSRGSVVKAQQYAAENWVVRVEWDLSRPISFYDVTLGDVSLNLYKKREPVTDEFSKSEFEKLVKVL